MKTDGKSVPRLIELGLLDTVMGDLYKATHLLERNKSGAEVSNGEETGVSKTREKVARKAAPVPAPKARPSAPASAKDKVTAVKKAPKPAAPAPARPVRKPPEAEVPAAVPEVPVSPEVLLTQIDEQLVESPQSSSVAVSAEDEGRAVAQ